MPAFLSACASGFPEEGSVCDDGMLNDERRQSTGVCDLPGSLRTIARPSTVACELPERPVAEPSVVVCKLSGRPVARPSMVACELPGSPKRELSGKRLRWIYDARIPLGLRLGLPGGRQRLRLGPPGKRQHLRLGFPLLQGKLAILAWISLANLCSLSRACPPGGRGVREGLPVLQSRRMLTSGARMAERWQHPSEWSPGWA